MDNSEKYIKLVCDFCKLPVILVTSKMRYRELCEARQLICYFLTLYTPLSLYKIAAKVNYVSHASVLRDKRNIPMFLETDKKFAAKYERLFESAEKLSKKLMRAEEKDMTPSPGDICWFWNDYSKTPSIGSFERSYLNEDNQQRFVNREHPTIDYSGCIYAGEDILPERFRESLVPSEVVLTSYLPALISA